MNIVLVPLVTFFRGAFNLLNILFKKKPVINKELCKAEYESFMYFVKISKI